MQFAHLRKETQADLPGIEIPLFEDWLKSLHEREDQRITEAAQ